MSDVWFFLIFFGAIGVYGIINTTLIKKRSQQDRCVRCGEPLDRNESFDVMLDSLHKMASMCPACADKTEHNHKWAAGFLVFMLVGLAITMVLVAVSSFLEWRAGKLSKKDLDFLQGEFLFMILAIPFFIRLIRTARIKPKRSCESGSPNTDQCAPDGKT